MKRYITFFAVFMLFFLGINTIFAQPKVKAKAKVKHNRLMEELKLTDDQQAKFDQLHYDQEAKAIDTRSEIAKNKLEIRKLMDADQLDETKLLQLTKRNNELRSQLQESRLKMWFEIYNSLDDTQKEIWKENRIDFDGDKPGPGVMRDRGFDGPRQGMGRMNPGQDFQRMPNTPPDFQQN